MIAWKHTGHAWLDVWSSQCGRCMIARHPRHDRGDHVIWIDGERICQRDTLDLAKWKAQNILEEKA